MEFIDKFKRVLPKDIDFNDLYVLAPSEMWKNDTRKAAYYSIKRAKIFNEELYLKEYEDVKKSKINSILHYIYNGIDEGRKFFYKASISIKRKYEPFFSIIMPSFNRANCIDKAINSVLSQTYKNFELIIIDDGSNDNTEQVISKYSSELKNKKIIYIRNKFNQGVAASRNIGIQNSHYEWIAYIDSDNTILPDFLEVFYKNIISHANYNIFYAQFKFSDGKVGLSKAFSYQDIKKRNFIDLGVFVHKKGIIRNNLYFDSNLKRLVDWDFILGLTKYNKPFFIDKIVMIYFNDKTTNRISIRENVGVATNYISKKHNLDIPTISAIIVSFNQEKYIENAIKSALNQDTGCKYEIIISDDGSTDSTHSIIAKYSQLYPTLITDISQNKNVGISNNYKRCFEKAKGDYISLLEGDDFWYESKLREHKKFLDDHLDCTMVFSKIRILNDKNYESFVKRQDEILTDELGYEDLFRDNFLNPIINLSSCTFRAKYIKNLPNRIYGYRFSEICVSLYLLKYGNIGFINRILNVWRHHSGSSWTGLNNLERKYSAYKIRCLSLSFLSGKYKTKLNDIINKEYLFDNELVNYINKIENNTLKKYVFDDSIRNKCFTKLKKRLGIFVLYDKDGVVDDYVLYLLDDICKVLTNLQVICNCSLLDEEKYKLKKYTNYIIERENKGFDIVAWKKSLTEYNDIEYIKQYDEIVLFNDSFYGPLYSFTKIFDTMDKKKVDFWGITRHHEEYRVPAFIQSYFTVFRKKIISNKAFYEHWISLKDDLSFNEAVHLHEVAFEKKFNNLGFASDVLIDYNKLSFNKYECLCLNTYMPYTMITSKKLPLIRRKDFIFNQNDILKNSSGNELKNAFYYIKKYTDYPTQYIVKNLLRCYSIVDIFRSMRLISIIPDYAVNKNFNCKVAIIIHIYYDDKLYESIQYLKEIPKFIDIYVTTYGNNKKSVIVDVFNKYNIKYKKIIVGDNNQGREQSCLLISCKEILNKYKYVCFLHDKKTTGTNKGKSKKFTQGSSFQNIFFECLLKNKNYIMSIIDKFEGDKFLGLLVPPFPLHGSYSVVLGREWTNNFDCTKQLLKKIGVNSDISINKQPISLGTAFWCRVDALYKLFSYNWKYDDFPTEPIPDNDGTIMHAIERSFAFVAQDAGYYTEWVMSSDFASTEIFNQSLLSENIFNTLRDVTGEIAAYNGYEKILYKYLRDDFIISKSKLFDDKWYKNRYNINIDGRDKLAKHYLLNWNKGYSPSQEFNNERYRELNPDVAERDIPPLLHYLKNGRFENRRFK